ncbi:SDR family NAD(P)-dependent oxidoreductase [Candidatus Planktophila dulcis]|uniref:SDR family NAD(P)-dependent oxidoreductase n=1 Tax=Candidatus Planktophila dulcis TaxID=1884914 RepID=UPI003CF92FD7
MTKKRKVLITGATGSLGEALARKFSTENYDLITTSRTPRSEPNRHIICDLEEPIQLANLCADIRSIGIDVIINNAGINLVKPFDEIDLGALEKTLQINLIAPVLLTQAAIPNMLANNWGRVINVGSILGQISRAGRSTYSISKAGLVGFTKAISAEYAEHGITSNCVAPGYLDSELTRKNLSQEEIEIVIDDIPAKRLGKTEEISCLVAFLASEDSGFITGQVLTADGGQVSS